MKYPLSIVIPSYNEQDNLVYLYNSLDPVIAAMPEVQILIVDNGSTDDSARIMREESDKRPNAHIEVVTVETNIGYGYGILSGLRAADADVLSVTHADRQTDPMDVLKAYAIYQEHKNPLLMVKGYRKARRLGEAFFSGGMAAFASLMTGTSMTEINAQPKLMSKSFFDRIEQDAPNDFALDLYLVYKAKKLGTIIDFPVYFLKRVAGEAKGGSGSGWRTRWKLIKRSLNYILEIRKTLN